LGLRARPLRIQKKREKWRIMSSSDQKASGYAGENTFSHVPHGGRRPIEGRGEGGVQNIRKRESTQHKNVLRRR